MNTRMAKIGDSNKDDLDDKARRLTAALTTIERSGAPGATIVVKRNDGHACGWCRGIVTPCPVVTAHKALKDFGSESGAKTGDMLMVDSIELEISGKDELEQYLQIVRADEHAKEVLLEWFNIRITQYKALEDMELWRANECAKKEGDHSAEIAAHRVSSIAMKEIRKVIELIARRVE